MEITKKMFRKVVWQHMQSGVGPMIIALLQINWRIYSVKGFDNRLRFDRSMAISLACIFWRNVYMLP